MTDQANTPQLWDRVWQNSPSAAAHRYELAREEHTIRWRRIETRVHAAFDDFKNVRAIEIGAGAGTNAALMAQRGSRVTVLDYSERALARAQELFAANGTQGEFVLADALALPEVLRGQFDLSMSFGLNEHFTGAARLEIFRAHLTVLRRGGMSLISIPNAHNPPYRAFKGVAQTLRLWKLGVEIPFTRRELEAICRELGVRRYEFFGDSFLTSWQFVNPWRYIRKRLPLAPDHDPTHLPYEHGTALDERWSYATVMVLYND